MPDQVVFVIRLVVVPAHIKVSTKSPGIEANTSFFGERASRAQSQHGDRARVRLATLRKPQAKRAPESFFQIAGEPRITHVEIFAFWRSHLNRVARGVGILLIDRRRIQKTRTKENQFAALPCRHPWKVRPVAIVDECKNAVANQSGKTHAGFFQVFTGHAFHRIATQDA